jgi:hypothetical protein
MKLIILALITLALLAAGCGGQTTTTCREVGPVFPPPNSSPVTVCTTK